jgi:hypothetical protein
MENLSIILQTIGIDYFKIIMGFITTALGAMVGLNSFWIKKYISDSKETSNKIDVKIDSIVKYFDTFNDKFREENFKIKLEQANVQKDISGLDKRIDESSKFQKERMDSHSIKIENSANEIIILKEFMQNINDKYENIIKDVNKSTSANEMVKFLKDQFSSLQDQINNIKK